MKFKNKEEKQTILNNCKTMKPSNLYINENLIPGRARILTVLRRMRRERPSRLSAVGSRDGRVFAWVKPPNPASSAFRRIVSTMNEVEQLCGEFDLNFADVNKYLSLN